MRLWERETLLGKQVIRTKSCRCLGRENAFRLDISRSVISERSKAKIRRLRAEGTSYRRIGLLYGVTRQAIFLIINGQYPAKRKEKCHLSVKYGSPAYVVVMFVTIASA